MKKFELINEFFNNDDIELYYPKLGIGHETISLGLDGYFNN
jgi:hypothetical protein